MSRRQTLFTSLLATLAVLLVIPALAGARNITWGHGIRIEPTSRGGIGAVACANNKICVAGDGTGHLLSTTNVTATKDSWKTAYRTDSDGGITGVSCPTTRFCAAVDSGGGLTYSTRPTSGSWTTPTRIDSSTLPGGGYAGFTSISCPSSSLCVATDASDNGKLYWSTHPTGGKSSWHYTTLTGLLTSVSCGSNSLCVAAGTQRYVSATPTGGTSAWKASGALSGGGIYSGVNCQSATLCMAVGYSGSSTAFSTGTKTPTNNWGNQANVGSSTGGQGQGLLDSVGCTEGTCVATDTGEQAFATSGIIGGNWHSFGPIRSQHSRIQSAVACKDLVCVVGDSSGVATTAKLK
ncbi:MAG: hypothetical protein J2O48_01455 [Solirubrobacterales bacterium]|nr:hypothetical protein [Solirubrobacterales bacterium]